MHPRWSSEVYSPSELAHAAGVALDRVVMALGRADVFVGHADAVRLGRLLAQEARAPFSSRSPEQRGRPFFFAVSTTVHAGAVTLAIFVTTVGLVPAGTTLRTDDPRETRLVFIATPGPGGGGGGGGLLQPTQPPKALREGRRQISSPAPVRKPPDEPNPLPAAPPDPTPPPLHSDPLPLLAAPIVAAPADARDRVGVLEEAREGPESRGPGRGGGAGTGAGTGLGQGTGSGVGPGSDGGTGGGPFRPGSGIQAPRLLHEVKADYTEDARRRGVTGEVVMEIVITRDGSVGDVKILRRLGAGLDERAEQAVHQWRFAPATRKGLPVDVIVEVAVEFKLR
jgi:periplasmic protein TonB